MGFRTSGTKHGNQKTPVYWEDKLVYVAASRKEARRAIELLILKRDGEITQLEFQKDIVIVKGRYIGSRKYRDVVYRADFTYYDMEHRLHIEDTKGFRTQEYRLKKKLMLLLLGLQIEEL